MTPMIKQYLTVKEMHKDCILFWRLGDFYEMFFEDAEKISREIGLTLTGRDCGMEKKAPMCGVPHHAAANYIRKIVDRGHSVAIAEQVAVERKGKMVFDREVVRIITPGTVTDLLHLDERANNFVASVYFAPKQGSVSWCDITTGQFYSTVIESGRVAEYNDVLAMVAAKEVISNDVQFATNKHYDYAFQQGVALDTLLGYFKIVDTKVFDFDKTSVIVRSAGALLEFLMQTQKKSLGNIAKVTVLRNDECMVLDKGAREHLELTHAFGDKTKRMGSLLWVLDDTKTSMGARLLGTIIGQPLMSLARIKQRHDAVESLVLDSALCKTLRERLGSIGDISRLTGRVASGDIMPRQMLSLVESLAAVGELKREMRDCAEGVLTAVREGMNPLADVVSMVKAAIVDEPPAKLEEGGYIRRGYDSALDECLDALTQGQTWISQLEQREQKECGIKDIRVKYNRVFGYYFEIPRKHSDKVPYRFTRKGTTVSAEKYSTQELDALSEKISTAGERAAELERRILEKLREELHNHIGALGGNAECVAVLDVLCNFAHVAVGNNWVRPNVVETGEMKLVGARHPVVEQLVGRAKFIANDCELGKGTTMVITGPNMAGKSTYMRTVAMCVLMAHMGCYVPADSATISLADRIFTRIGASDSQVTGQSTFMVEMNEVSNIVHNATSRSLLLLDEIGRGTGTRDGVALAEAIITYLTKQIGAATMFATHFHELTDLQGRIKGLVNFKVMVSEVDGQIVFLHKVVKGTESNSFGIDVAKLAGLPEEIICHAKELIKRQSIISMHLGGS